MERGCHGGWRMERWDLGHWRSGVVGERGVGTVRDGNGNERSWKVGRWGAGRLGKNGGCGVAGEEGKVVETASSGR